VETPTEDTPESAASLATAPNRDDVARVDPEALAIRGQLEPRQGPGAAAGGVLELLGDFVEFARDLERLAGRE
jgi:hypothetical protein